LVQTQQFAGVLALNDGAISPTVDIVIRRRHRLVGPVLGAGCVTIELRILFVHLWEDAAIGFGNGRG
jgi:hypothetical protein